MAIFSHIEHISHKYSMKVKFSHIDHISHKYPLKVKFSQKWPYFHTLTIFNTNIHWKSNFHTLSIFHTNIHWKSNFHTNGQIFTHWPYFTQISIESQIFTQMAIFSHIEHISHKYPLKVKFSHKWSYFYTLSIFYASFCYFLLRSWFLKFLTFSWWLLRKYRASLVDGILGLIIEVAKGGISSNWSNSSSSIAFSTPTICRFPGITALSVFCWI
jgi:hypothetical protein